jgi:hypothetical protein
VPSEINWGSVADWVSGLGSFAAVLAALYLARASERIKLKGFCGVRTILGGGIASPLTVGGNPGRRTVIFLSVTNVGTRATVINHVGMRVGRFRRRRGVLMTVRDADSVGTPYPLADGQEAHWALPIGSHKNWLRNELCKGFVDTADDVRTLRFTVHTNHGETLTLKPEEGVRKAILAVLAETVAQKDSRSA